MGGKRGERVGLACPPTKVLVSTRGLVMVSKVNEGWAGKIEDEAITVIANNGGDKMTEDIIETGLICVNESMTMGSLASYLLGEYGYGMIRYHYTRRGTVKVTSGAMHIEYLEGNGLTVARDIGSGISFKVVC